MQNLEMEKNEKGPFFRRRVTSRSCLLGPRVGPYCSVGTFWKLEKIFIFFTLVAFLRASLS